MFNNSFKIIVSSCLHSTVVQNPTWLVTVLSTSGIGSSSEPDQFAQKPVQHTLPPSGEVFSHEPANQEAAVPAASTNKNAAEAELEVRNEEEEETRDGSLEKEEPRDVPKAAPGFTAMSGLLFKLCFLKTGARWHCWDM